MQDLLFLYFYRNFLNINHNISEFYYFYEIYFFIWHFNFIIFTILSILLLTMMKLLTIVMAIKNIFLESRAKDV